MDRRVAHDSPVERGSPGLELGLDERDERATGRAEARGHRPEDEPQRDEGDVDDGQVDRLRQDATAERPGVRSLERHDPRVTPERLGQLAAPDVDGVDAARAALEEDVA